MDLVQIEDALHAWVVGAFGLDPSKVTWGHQAGPAPEPVAVSLDLIGPYRAGEEDIERDAAPGAPAGAEIELVHREHMEWNLTVQVRSQHVAGAQKAHGLAEVGRLKMRLPSPVQRLRAVGLAVLRVGDTQDLTALFATAFESRAFFEVRLRTVDEAIETTGYIERIGVTSPLTGSFDAP